MSVVDRVRQEHPHHEAITILNWAFPSTFPTVPVVVHHPRRDRSFGPSSLPCSISTDGCHKVAPPNWPVSRLRQFSRKIGHTPSRHRRLRLSRATMHLHALEAVCLAPPSRRETRAWFDWEVGRTETWGWMMACASKAVRPRNSSFPGAAASQRPIEARFDRPLTYVLR